MGKESERLGLLFGGLGFEFKFRAVPNGGLMSVIRPVEVELNTIEDLITLQKKLGYGVLLVDGYLEVVS